MPKDLPFPCEICRRIAPDLLAVVKELQKLKVERFRGTVEYRLDGSGRIISSLQHRFHEIKLTSQRQQE